MDTVEGAREDSACLLTLLHRPRDVYKRQGANHASARKPLAANERDAVELCLQLLVVRNLSLIHI